MAVKATVDPSGQALTGWRRQDGADTSYCTWDGITCVNGAVTEIQVIDRDLDGGKLPSADILQGLPQLTRLRFQNCGLDGELPASLPPSLRILALGDNSISGTIPDWSSGSLEEVYVWKNQLSGTLPLLQGLQRLATLQCQRNALTGPVPASWATAPWAGGVTYIDLSDNRLVGGLPAEWGLAMVQLQELWVVRSNLTGPLPDTWRSLLQLRVLGLWENALTGMVPAWLGGLSNLQLLWLNTNALGGTLPPELGRLAKLRELYLGNNRFVGSVPPEWAGMDTINTVTLWGNSNMTGCLPAVWQGKVNQPGGWYGLADLTSGTGITGFCPVEGAVVARDAAPVAAAAAGVSGQQLAAPPPPSSNALSGGPPPSASMHLRSDDVVKLSG